MPIRFIEDDRSRKALLTYIEQQPLPITVSITAGGHRTLKQNRLQRQWLNEIAEQLGDRTAEEVRGECKLMFGVPILRAENDAFCKAYDKSIKGRPYEEKVALMMEPLDLPVTRLMTTKQHTKYLDAMLRHFSAMGIVLTDPGDLLFKADVKALEEHR